MVMAEWFGMKFLLSDGQVNVSDARHGFDVLHGIKQ